MKPIDRRHFLKAAGGVSLIGCCSPLIRAAELMPQRNQARVAVIGGGFAGAIAAKTLRQLNAEIEVVLIERNRSYTALPGSNWILGGSRRFGENRLVYDRLESSYGVKMLYGEALAIDGDKRQVVLDQGTLGFDIAIVAPGIAFRGEEIEDYDPVGTAIMLPHAWGMGEEVAVLKRRLDEMKDGGVVVVTLPLIPFRCPQAAYERVSQIALSLKQTKPRSKILVLDANPNIVSLPELFRNGWTRHYKDIIEYRPGQPVTRVDTVKSSVTTPSGIVHGDVINLIPPQMAGLLAHKSGLVGEDRRWCPVDLATNESSLVSSIHVLGDACFTQDMQKSASAAYAQARMCAFAVSAKLSRRKWTQPNIFSSVVYSLLNEREGASSVMTYRGEGRKLEVVGKGSGDAGEWSEMEAIHGRAWLGAMLTQMSS